MRDASSADRPFDVPSSARAAMIALGALPLLHVLASAAPIALAATGGWRWWRAPIAAAVLYLAPAIATRALLGIAPLTDGVVEMGSPAFLRWWAALQLQMVFARVPLFEEALRLVPGVYSAWLRLWGARVGRLVYWSPGVTVLDRPLLSIGDRAVVGTRAAIVPHVIAPRPGAAGSARRSAVLVIGRVTVGADAIVGAYSRLLPGCDVAAGEVTPPFRSVHPFTRVEHGRRAPRADAPLAPASIAVEDVPRA